MNRPETTTKTADFREKQRLSLAELRDKIGAIAHIDPLPGWPLPGSDLVLPRGALVELLGTGSREWLFEVFKSQEESRIAWLEPVLTLFPPAVSQRGISLSRFLFVETKKELHWALLKILGSKLFHFAVTETALVPARNADVFLRKLQIQAERAGTTLFFLSETETPLFAITHRIRVDSGHPRPEVLKRKRG